MNTTRRKFRKRPYQEPHDGTVLASTLREIGERVHARDYAAGLSQANQVLAAPGLTPHDQSRVLSLVADSEFKRGRFEEAAGIYLQASTRSLDHHELWLRPLFGHVHALLKAPRVEQALLMARHAVDVAEQKMAAFEQQVRQANRRLAENGQVFVPPLPPRVSVVASRLGYLFLQEGEPESAREFFEQALVANPRGACRARQGLARVALAMNDPGRALELAEDSIRRGKFGAKTLSSWPLLIAARRRLGGWQIKERLLAALDRAPASIRSRAVLIIVRELRKHNMRQWREFAETWSAREGGRFPIVEAEIRKMILASAKTVPGDATGKRELAEQLLQTPGLSRNEWLAAAKEVVRASLWEGRTPDLDGLIRYADTQYGQDSGPRAIHSLALSCMMAKRHDLAHPLLQRNIRELPPGDSVWAKSVWALARMESFLGNHTAAAGLYRQFFEAESLPIRFRLQAQLLWVKTLITAGQPDALLEARPLMTAALSNVQDPDILMNFARQLQHGPAVLRAWGKELFSHGEALALEQFREAAHPTAAVAILFKLTRRQVHDFGCYEQAISLWESFDEKKQNWLWSDNAFYWAYLGQVFEAYYLLGDFRRAESFARSFLDDSATPSEGLAHIGIPYGRRLIRQGRSIEGLNLFERLVRSAPTHPLCAYAWYWLALASRKQGDMDQAKEYASRVRIAQGVNVGMLDEWDLDVKALLLLADLDPGKVDAQAVNYTTSRLVSMLDEINSDLDLIIL
ncbi:MAG: tetratricopeptide repeat protein [Verrucomicrobia bacterium]|nr:tetratricopeptide repeat protein [Verrucomicrobiota bacterium]